MILIFKDERNYIYIYLSPGRLLDVFGSQKEGVHFNETPSDLIAQVNIIRRHSRSIQRFYMSPHSFQVGPFAFAFRVLLCMTIFALFLFLSNILS